MKFWEFYEKNMKTIALSAGHGAGDPGAVYKDLQEATLTDKITKKAVDMIRKHGVDCLEVPGNLDLVNTIKWINERSSQINVCVEVHVNRSGSQPPFGTGVEAWNYQGGPNESDKLSQFLADALAAETGLKNRGIKDESLNLHKKLGFVHDTNPVAALAECGFIDGDYDFLAREENLTRMAKGIARGCLSYIEVKWNPGFLVLPTPPTQPVVDWQAKYNAEVKEREADNKAKNNTISTLNDALSRQDEEVQKLRNQLTAFKLAVSGAKKMFEPLPL